MLATIGQQNSDFVGLIVAWRAHELEAMAQGTTENFGVSKGRVQALTEMQRLLSPHIR